MDRFYTIREIIKMDIPEGAKTIGEALELKAIEDSGVQLPASAELKFRDADGVAVLVRPGH